MRNLSIADFRFQPALARRLRLDGTKTDRLRSCKQFRPTLYNRSGPGIWIKEIGSRTRRRPKQKELWRGKEAEGGIKRVGAPERGKRGDWGAPEMGREGDEANYKNAQVAFHRNWSYK